ncbi:hypothetical protein FRC02_005877 [Tulasnella sp. 418]|nr:hypothetical protein FRC02_005877 [Tulasnella sp. 418]
MSAKRSESPPPAEENPAFKRRKQEKPSSDHTQEELALDATSHQVSALDFTRNFDLNVPGASIFYQDEFIDATTAQQWYDELANLSTWYRPTLKVYGKKITQSRLIAAYSPSPGLTLKYSGQTVIMNYPYPDILSDIQDRVEKALGVSFNHVMLNKYDDGTVYIGKHSDSIENKVLLNNRRSVQYHKKLTCAR